MNQTDLTKFRYCPLSSAPPDPNISSHAQCRPRQENLPPPYQLSAYVVQSYAWQDAFWDILPERAKPPTLQVRAWRTYIQSVQRVLAVAESPEEFLDIANDLQQLDLLAVIDEHYHLLQKALASKGSDPKVIQALGKQAILELISIRKTLAKIQKDKIRLDEPVKTALFEQFEILAEGITTRKSEYRKLISHLEPLNRPILPEDISNLDQAFTQARKPTWLGRLLGAEPLELSENAKKIVGFGMRLLMLSPFTATAARGAPPKRQGSWSMTTSSPHPAYAEPTYPNGPIPQDPPIDWPKTLEHPQRADLLALIPDARHVEPLSANGINQHYRVTTQEGVQYFFKTFVNEEKNNDFCPNLVSRNEAAASQLANYLTSGLVPEGRASGNSIAYPYHLIDKKTTQKVFPWVDSCQTLSASQKVDLFVNMIADMVLYNVDAHAGQFGVTENGQLISFDKGRSYWTVLHKQTEDFSRLFKPTTPYRIFLDYLKGHQEELNAVIADPRVQTALRRLETLTRVDQRPVVKALLSPMFNVLSQSAKEKFSEVCANYFTMLKEVPQMIAEKLGVSTLALTPHPLSIQNKGENTFITFDPTQYGLQLIAPLSEGYVAGDRVSNVVEKAGGILGMNAGFFTHGTGARWSMNWMLSKAQQYTGSDTQAFPSAILHVNGQLLSDTPDYLPAIGWNKAGTHLEIGNIKVVWQAELPETHSSLLLRRVTPIDSHDHTATFYYDVGTTTKAITVQNGVISEKMAVPQVDTEKPNGFVLIDPSQAVISALENLQRGQSFSPKARFEAKDPQQTERLQDLEYMVSGGALLIQNGHVDIDCASYVDRGRRTSHTAMCIRADGKVSLVTSFEDQTLTAFADMIQQQLPDTVKAISLDGGSSTTLCLPTDTGWRTAGNNPVVSDTIILTESNGLAAKLQSQNTQVFEALSQGNLNRLRRLLAQDPSRIHARNHNQQGLLQAYLTRFMNGRPNSEIIRLLLDRMTTADCEQADIFGETVVHTALRHEQEKLALQLLDKIEKNSPIWVQEGFRKETIAHLLPFAILLDKHLADRFLSNPRDYNTLFLIRLMGKMYSFSLEELPKAQVVTLLETFATDSVNHVAELEPLVETLIHTGHTSAVQEALFLLSMREDKQMPPRVLPLVHIFIKNARGTEIDDLLEEIDIVALFESQNLVLLGAELDLVHTIEKGGHRPEAIERLTQALVVSMGGVDLLDTLVRRGHGIPEAIEVLRRLPTSQYESILIAAIPLARTLIAKGHGIPEVIKLCQRLSESQSRDSVNEATSLVMYLVENGHGIPEVNELIKQLSKSQDPVVVYHLIHMAQTLVQNGHGIAAAIELFQRLSDIQNGLDPDTLMALAELASTLIWYGRSMTDVLAFLEKLSQHDLSATRDSVWRLAIALVQGGHGIAAAIAVCENLLKGGRIDFYPLVELLVRRGHGIEITNMMERAINLSKHSNTFSLAVSLLETLVENEYGIMEASEFLKRHGNGNTKSPRMISLARLLAESEQGRLAVIEVFNKIPDDSDLSLED